MHWALACGRFSSAALYVETKVFAENCQKSCENKNRRCAPESGHVRCTSACLLWANSGLMQCSKKDRYSITSALVGNRNWNTAPLGTLGKARSCPPCDSMMVRLTASPIPMPSGLVV
jgi:hypothetical protein